MVQWEPTPVAECGAAECVRQLHSLGVCVGFEAGAVSRADEAHQEGVAENSVSAEMGAAEPLWAPTREEALLKNGSERLTENEMITSPATSKHKNGQAHQTHGRQQCARGLTLN